jgi:hypothetical protein
MLAMSERTNSEQPLSETRAQPPTQTAATQEAPQMHWNLSMGERKIWLPGLDSNQRPFD